MTGFGDPILFEFAGLLGVAVYIGSYLALQLGMMRGTGYAYPALNLAAASLVLISLSQAFNLSSAIIQATWIVISVFGIVRIYLLSRRLRFDAEELTLVEQALAHMPRQAARRFLDAGSWVDLPAGEVLTQEGRPVEALWYLAEGEASVTAGTREVARLTGGFIGELGILNADTATATVRTTTPCRVFRIPGDSLRRLCRNDQDFSWMIEKHLSDATKRKLAAANARLSRTEAT